MMADRRGGSAERVWRERLGRYRRCELTVAEFCQREGVSTASFYAWRRRLEGGSQRRSSRQRAGSSSNRTESSDESPLFVPVSVKPSRDCEVRIELPSGAVVRLSEGADERLVQSCIRAAAEAGESAEGKPC